MTLMNRGIKYLYRKKGRTLILFMLMVVISIGILGSVSIQKATDMSRQKMKKAFNTHFTVLPNPGVSWGIGSRGFGDIPESMVEFISRTEGISRYQATLIGEANLPGMSKKLLDNPRVQFNPERENLLKEHFDFEGSLNTELDHKFISGVLKLTEGRHLNEEDDHKIIVHEEFAKMNGLKLHDKVKFGSSKVNEFVEFKDDDVEIVGLFSGSNLGKANHSEELFENMIISDIETAKLLRGYSDGDAMYDRVDFFVDNPEQLEDIYQNVKELNLPWEKYQLSQGEQNYAGILDSLNSMDLIIKQMLVGTLVISVLVLTLVLWFWIQGRIHETGILMSIGVSKLNIIFQYMVEVWIVAVMALVLAVPLSGQLSQKLGEGIVKQAQEKTQANQQSELGGMSIGGDANSSVISQTVDSLDVQVEKKELLKVIMLGSMVVILSVGSASINIIRMQPKEILSKMS